MEGKLQGLRIAWLLDNFPNPYQVYIKNLVNNLRRIYGLNITIVTYRSTGANRDIDNPIKLIKLENRFEQYFNGLIGRSNTKAENYLADFDLIHVQHSFMYPFISRIARSDSKSKFVITFRGADSYIKPWISDQWKKYHHEIGSNFHAIQVMSRNQGEYLSKWGYGLEKIHIIPISTSTVEAEYIDCSINGKLNICSVFRMTWEKNIEANLRFIKLLKESGIEVKYNVFGDGTDFGQLYYLIDRFGLEKEVKIYGRVVPSVLSSEIKNNHFMLQLSSSEALPASIIEAMSFGIPCIVSDVGGLPEIVHSNENGFVIDFNNYDLSSGVAFVLKVLENNTFYKKLKIGAFEAFKQQFSPEIETEKVYTMYCSVFKSDGKV